MNTENSNLPIFIALVGASFLAIVYVGSFPDDDGFTVMPLLALLAMCEFGFLISLAGIFLGSKGIREHATAKLYSATASCAILMIVFTYKGLTLWPG